MRRYGLLRHRDRGPSFEASRALSRMKFCDAINRAPRRAPVTAARAPWALARGRFLVGKGGRF
jgi:hypothetical protein